MAVSSAAGARLDICGTSWRVARSYPPPARGPASKRPARTGRRPLMRPRLVRRRLAVAHDGAVGPAARRGDHEQRDQQAEDADHHEDDADRGDLEARDVGVDGEVEDRADG